jgi:hypothetical protein
MQAIHHELPIWPVYLAALRATRGALPADHLQADSVMTGQNT